MEVNPEKQNINTLFSTTNRLHSVHLPQHCRCSVLWLLGR